MAFGINQLFQKLKPAVTAGPKHVVGIDFGTSSVKVVELEQRDELIALKTYGELQLGPYAGQPLGSVVQLPAQRRVEVLVDVMRESGVAGEAGVLALPLASSFVTVIGIRARADEDLGPRVKIEARKYVPVPLAEVSLDWSELPALPGTPEHEREVLIAAVQNESYREMNELMNAVHLTSQPTEVETFSVLRAVVKSDDTSVAIIDLGAQTSKLYLVQDGLVRKIHRVFAGGTQVTEQVANTLGVTFEGAENQKRNFDNNQTEATAIRQAMATTFDRPLQEFRRVIAQYEAQVGTPIARVVITGGSAAFADMISMVSYALDRPVERAHQFNKVAYPAFLEDVLNEIGPTFTVAIGAALRPYIN